MSAKSLEIHEMFCICETGWLSIDEIDITRNVLSSRKICSRRLKLLWTKFYDTKRNSY